MPVKMNDKMQILAYRNMYGRLYAIDSKNLKLFNSFLIWFLKCRVYIINISRFVLRKLFIKKNDTKI